MIHIFNDSHQSVFAALDRGESFAVPCPDGRTRELYGHNPQTGDLLVADWPDDVWAHCAGDRFGIEFD